MDKYFVNGVHIHPCEIIGYDGLKESDGIWIRYGAANVDTLVNFMSVYGDYVEAVEEAAMNVMHEMVKLEQLSTKYKDILNKN